MRIFTLVLAASIFAIQAAFVVIYSRLRWEASSEGRSAMGLGIGVVMLTAHVVTEKKSLLSFALIILLAASVERLRALVTARRRYKRLIRKE